MRAIVVFLALARASAAQDVLPIVVRPTELDVNNHVNNAKYVEYLQWGRWDWMERRGFGRARLAALESIPSVVRIEVNYRRPARLDDRLDVVTTPGGISGKSYWYRQEIRRGDELVADAVVTIANYSPAAGRAIPVPDELQRALTAPRETRRCAPTTTKMQMPTKPRMGTTTRPMTPTTSAGPTGSTSPSSSTPPARSPSCGP